MNKSITIRILMAAIILSSCHKKEEKKENSNKFVLSDTMAKMITFDSAKSCNIDDAITLSGEISFDENTVIKIYPRSSGQVLESKVSLGDKVTKGQPLAIIRSADIAGNYADLSGAEADIKIAKRQLDNTEALYSNGIASEKDLNEAKQNYQKAIAVSQKIQSVLTINSGSSNKPGDSYKMQSPINGYIVEKKVNTGNFIRPDMGDNLFTISDLKDVWVWANVYEADISKVKEGYTVQVTTLAYPDKYFTGKIDKISEVLDPSNKTLKVRIKLANPELLLKPEMFAKVIVSNTEQRKAICIPTKSLISQNGKNYVVVYHNKSDMRIAEVSIIKTVGEQTFLNAGVDARDQLIVQNQLLIFQQLLNE